MANPDGVLDAIDACLKDSLSPDAMRSAPDVGEWLAERGREQAGARPR